MSSDDSNKELFHYSMSNENANFLNNSKPLHNGLPTGLEVLYKACRKLYPQQPNPLQVTAVVKYWLGGPDPLDYISMYYNAGSKEENISPHWHYVSFGLSDLHGDGRVHDISEPDMPSGFGFELTMRIRCEGEETPPTWPAALMQGLAKYIFQSDSYFFPGDHISWHCALDNSESHIQHMLIAEDPQLKVQETPFGKVQFVQIVGVTAEELKAAQHWNGCGILGIMKMYEETGGEWLLTDMEREETIYTLDPSVGVLVEKGIEDQGSSLSGVSAIISWSILDLELETLDDLSNMSSMSISCTSKQDMDESLKPDVSSIASNWSPNDRTAPGVSIERETIVCESEVFVVHNLPSLHLSLNVEAGAILPLALKGRLKHGRHFTFKSRLGVDAVTFVSPEVEGAFASSSSPFMVKGPWLQIFLERPLIEEMIHDLRHLTDNLEVPVSFEWKEKKLKITIVGEEI